MIATFAETSVLDQLSAAMSRSMKQSTRQMPMVFEQNECVVVEMPAPRGVDDELEMHLVGDYALIVESPSHRFRARVALPARISLADSVVYCLGGVLSMTFLKAEVAEEMDFDGEPMLEMALAR